MTRIKPAHRFCEDKKPISLHRGVLLGLLALSLWLTACSGSELTPTDEQSAPSSTTTAPVPPVPTTVPVTSTSVAQARETYPVTVQSDLGPVTIASQPRRIVSLSATHTEMLFAIGAAESIAATDLTSNFPTAAIDTAKVDSFNFNIEEVAALAPDLVIVAFDFQGETEALTALDIPFLLLAPPDTVDAALSQLRSLGIATGLQGEAVALIESLVSRRNAMVEASAPLRGISIYHEVDETLYSATSASYIGDVYSLLGLVNIADAVDGAGQFPQLSSEFIVEQNPDFIFLADANFGVTAESVAGRPGWDTIRAVSAGNVVALDGDIAGRWGPRTIDLMQSIFEAVGGKMP